MVKKKSPTLHMRLNPDLTKRSPGFNTVTKKQSEDLRKQLKKIDKEVIKSSKR